MADGPRSTRNKKVEKKGKKTKTNKKRKWAVWLFFTGAVAIVCGIIGYLLIILNGERILADNQDKFILPESSTIYDAKGKEVTKLSQAGGNRETVEFADIPLLMREAVIATEDRRFEEHSGIDLYSIGRAVVKDIVARSAVEGGSTITQQLAKNLFLTQDKTFFRKATEASIAVALEHKKTKDEIITMYLNRIYFGKGAYGIKEAASFYFDTELKDLKLWQMATLAAIPKAPGNYNPINNPINSQERRSVVLQLMFDQGYITQAEMDEAKAVEYKRPANQTSTTDDSNLTFIDYVVDEAVEKSGLTEEELRVGGYKIYTTLNTQAQSVMAREFEDDDNFEKSVDDKQEQGAMIIVDHRNGEIQGMMGGRDYVNKGLNRVVQPRQPGSAFKPITVYGPAVESGDWFPWSILQDVKTCYGSYCPSDSNKVKYIGPVPMRQSLKESRNASAVWLLNELGVKTGLKFADKMGFELDSSKDRNLAIGLGGLTNGVTPFEMARAYSAFANEGKSVDPHALIKITDKNEEVLYQYDAPQPEQLMSPKTAYYMTDMMQAVTEKGGTGTAARIDRPVAGKTGTTQHGIPGLRTGNNRDAWFAGYTAEWTAVVWMGYDITDKNHMIKKSSAQSAAMFGKVMKDAIKGVKKDSFAKPSDVQEEKPPVGITNFNAIYDEAAAFVKLSWSPIEGEGVQYHVYRKEASEKDFIKLLDSLEPAVDDMNVAPGMSYTYYVTAYDANKNMEGTPSDRLTVEIPEAEITPPPTDEPGGEIPPGDGNETPPGDGEPGDGTTPPGDGNNGGGTPDNGGETPGNGGETPGNGDQPTGPGNGNTPGNGTGDSGNTPGGDGSVPADGQPDPGAGNANGNGNGATNSPPPATP